MRPQSDDDGNDDFFGIQYDQQNPLPSRLLPRKNTFSDEETSNLSYIDAQYFCGLDDRHLRMESQQSWETNDELNYIESQYFGQLKNRNIDCRRDPPELTVSDDSHRFVDDGKKGRYHLGSSERMNLCSNNIRTSDEVLSVSTRDQLKGRETFPEQKGFPLSMVNSPRITQGKTKTVDTEENGLYDLHSNIPPVWKFTTDQLVSLICSSVIYEDDSLIAINKPYGLAYSGSLSGRPQFDRILQEVKRRLTPTIDRLHLLWSVDKKVTGVIIFAKSNSVQQALRQADKENLVEKKYDTLVVGEPQHEKALINIPLIKKTNVRNMMMLPVMSTSKRNGVRVETNYCIINANKGCSLLECDVLNEVPHQIRSHLGLGINCPIFGDAKYNPRRKFDPPKIPPVAMQSLSISGNDYRQLPLYLHLKEVILPVNRSRVSIKAPMPSFFTYTLKHLKLLKRHF
ncbi:hypothetical protein AB6A40_009224 [Gnathostoma spinigerum]|uniref:Pseudouridylate synthase RPUSD4, mitochondrial n=1 Tax=Gnathostoma spinigerum TaxID=75299 RepID=A0ABD6F174_9BILA